MEKISENKKISKRLFLLTLVCLFILTIVSVVNAQTCTCSVCDRMTYTCVTATGPCPCPPACTSANCVECTCSVCDRMTYTCVSRTGPCPCPPTCTSANCVEPEDSCTCSVCDRMTYTCVTATGPCPCPPACTSANCVAPTSGCASGETECYTNPSDPSDIVCCGSSGIYCQPGTGNRVYDTGECAGTSCRYQVIESCGICSSYGTCSDSGCSCDSSCTLPVPGCDSYGRLCTALAPDTCGYASSSCYPCPSGYICGMESGAIGCYASDDIPPELTCSEIGGAECEDYETCYGSDVDTSDLPYGGCCVPGIFCGPPSSDSCGTDCFCDTNSQCSSRPTFYSTGESCTDAGGNSGTCCCVSAAASTCGTPGHEECEPEYGETTYTCPEDCDNGGNGDDCNCGLFSDQGCGLICGSLTCNDNEMCKKRTCIPSDCKIEEKCEFDSSCADSYTGLAVDVLAMSNFYNKGVPVVLLNISNPDNLANGNLILSVHDEDDVLRGLCNRDISLTENKLFFGTVVKNAHFYPWAESALFTDEEIYECKEGGMGNYMDDDCKHHDSSEESFVNSDESKFYSDYPGLLILENTLSYLSSPDNFFEVELSACMSLFNNLDPGIYDLTASLGVIP